MTEADPKTTQLAYLSSEYPCVSHTFIRREILELESLGYRITRVGLRKGPVVDPDDIAEAEHTAYLVGQENWLTTVGRIFSGVLAARWKIGTGLVTAVDLGRASERGLIRHIVYFAEALMLRAILKRQGVDHLHVHFGNNAASIALMCKKMGGPNYSMTVHGPDEFDAPVGESLGRKVSESEFTAAITNYCAGQIKRWTPYQDWNRVHIVHCTVGPEWFDGAEPMEDGAQDIVCVGRLTRNKGQLLLVDAFANAVEQGFTGNLNLIGDGDMREVIESRIASHGLAERVVLMGWCSGDVIKAQIQQSRALVLASFAEGLPVVLMESMACLRPVISTLITGVPELVEHGEHGWLVISGDQESLTEAIVELGQTPVSTLRKMGLTSQCRVRAQHSTHVEVAKLRSLFQAHATHS